MTKNEIREMINSTINSNGSRNISGKSLNIALNTILDYISNNDAVVTKELDDLSSKVNSLIRIDLQSGGNALRDLFKTYDLQNKLNTPIACLIKENSFDTTYQVATMVVEGFSFSGWEKGSDMYKISFIINDCNSELLTDENLLHPKYVWSAECFGYTKVKAYLYTPSSNMIQSLGISDVHKKPSNVIVEADNLKYANLLFENTYYVIEPISRTIEAILVAMENYDGVITWYNIIDNALEERYTVQG